MSLSARLDNPPPPGITGLPCSVGALRQELPTDEQAALDRMLYDLGWSATRVLTALTEEGYKVGHQTINKHRRGLCRCGKDGA